MSQLPNETSIPFAQFRFSGATVTMNQRQFEQALRDARLCRLSGLPHSGVCAGNGPKKI